MRLRLGGQAQGQAKGQAKGQAMKSVWRDEQDWTPVVSVDEVLGESAPTAPDAPTPTATRASAASANVQAALAELENAFNRSRYQS